MYGRVYTGCTYTGYTGRNIPGYTQGSIYRDIHREARYLSAQRLFLLSSGRLGTSLRRGSSSPPGRLGTSLRRGSSPLSWEARYLSAQRLLSPLWEARYLSAQRLLSSL